MFKSIEKFLGGTSIERFLEPSAVSGNINMTNNTRVVSLAIPLGSIICVSCNGVFISTNEYLHEI
jgi:hypothetical protein